MNNTLFEKVPLTPSPIVWSHGMTMKFPSKGYYHWHQCCELLIVINGKGTVIVNHQTYEMKPGMVFFFQPFELHKVFTDSGSDLLYDRTVIHFDPVVIESYLEIFPARSRLLHQLWKSTGSRRMIHLEKEIDHIAYCLRSYESAVQTGHGDTQEEITLLFLQLFSIMQHGLESEASSDRTERYSEKIMQWIEGHYMEEFSLEDLAEDIHLSKFYVSRIFKQETGSSITEYVTARRIKQACHLLETTLFSVEQISGQVGMFNTSHFIKMFKKVVGMTPLKYRHSHKNLTLLL